MERILSYLSNEEVSEFRGVPKNKFTGKEAVAKIVDDVYRKLQGTGATDSATDGQSGSNISSVIPKEEVIDSFCSDKKIRCPCGSSLPTEYMIQCADPKCHVSQHIVCVIIPEESLEGLPPVPPPFYCEICRINRVDPFWVTVAHPLLPIKPIVSNIPDDGTTPWQNMEKEFQITREDRQLLDNVEYDIQVWCILLNDSVQFRMQWPQYADLQVNGVPVKTVNRPGSQLLGVNGRDDGPMISSYIAEGFNKITLSGCDARSFCLGVRLVKQHTIQQVLNLIPSEQDGEPFADALARVCRCIGGGLAKANEDSDSDLEVIADSVTVNLRCPMSGSKINTASRFKPCAHMGCFDLETFVELNRRSRKWQCPICLKNYSLENIIIDPYFNRITKMMRDCGEDIIEIDVKPDGSWRAKNGYQFMNLGQWHLPDGSLCVSAVEIVPNLEGTAGQSNPMVAIKENGNGIVKVSKAHNMQTPSSGNQLNEYFENCGHRVITMSSSTSESGRDDGPTSINQYGTRHFDISANNDNEINSMSYNFDQTPGIINKSSSASFGDPDIIVLSDSEEENANLVSPRTVSISFPLNDSGNLFSTPSGIRDTYLEDPPLGPDPRFQLLGTNTHVSDAVVDLEHISVTSSAPINDYKLASKCTMDSGRQVVDSYERHSNADINDSLSYLIDCPPTSNSIRSQNWMLPELGSKSSGVGAHAESSTSNGLDLSKQFESNEASLLTSMNDEARSKGNTNRKMSDGPFSFPRQPRSARRPYLS